MIKHEIVNGFSTFLWWDNWHPNCPLLHTFGHRVAYDAAINLNAKVSTVIEGSSWLWPPARSDNLVTVKTDLFDYLLPMDNQQELVVWSLSSDGKFTVSSAWSYARAKKCSVDWFKLLWGPLFMPRFSFISWLAILNRLSTMERQMMGC